MSASNMTCLQCGESKPIAEMAIVKGKPIKTCKVCKNAYSREWRKKNPDRTAEYTRRKTERAGFREEHQAKMRARYHRLGIEENRDRALRRTYGISLADYRELERQQGGTCAICNGRPEVGILVVDHCHTSGIVRGLLCSTCNLAIGYLKDNPDHMLSAAMYVLRQTDVIRELT
jgi:hypothetical protein